MGWQICQKYREYLIRCFPKRHKTERMFWTREEKSKAVRENSIPWYCSGILHLSISIFQIFSLSSPHLSLYNYNHLHVWHTRSTTVDSSDNQKMADSSKDKSSKEMKNEEEDSEEELDAKKDRSSTGDSDDDDEGDDSNGDDDDEDDEDSEDDEIEQEIMGLKNKRGGSSSSSVPTKKARRESAGDEEDEEEAVQFVNESYEDIDTSVIIPRSKRQSALRSGLVRGAGSSITMPAVIDSDASEEEAEF